ncbi:MAG: hypothetical protein ACLPH3_05880 [Terracidiphilus sp.]
MKAKSDKEWLEQLSEAEAAQAEQMEKEAHDAADEGWSEETALAFVRGAMLIKERIPGTRIPNLLDMAIRQGIAGLVATVYAPKRGTARRGKLSGVGL